MSHDSQFRLDDEFAIRLSVAEVLVLYEFLSRGEDTGEGRYEVEDDSEQVIMWRLHGRIEESLPELFDPDYGQLLEAARARLVKADHDIGVADRGDAEP